jgi:hypothetical protein
MVTAAAGRGYSRVYGFQTRSGTALSLIDPTPAARRIEGLASPFGLVALGAHGRVLARARMLMRTAHTDGPHTGPVVLLKGAVPTRAGATAIAITEHGKTIAVRHRPAHTPRVKLLAPHRGRRLSTAKPLVVRWRATNPDRGRLTISIDYSSNGGRHWQMVAMVPNTGRATLRGSWLRPSRRARIRIRVNDGFDQAIAVSGLVQLTRPAHRHPRRP